MKSAGAGHKLVEGGTQLKVGNLWSVVLSVILFSSVVAYGRDLSKYRAFSLGSSLTDVSKQIDQKPIDATTLHQRPALLQQVTWWPSSSLGAARQGETIQQVRFSFYNDILYKMVVTYDAASTRGLTAEDVEGSLTARYGSPTGRVGKFKNDYGRTEEVLARWEDSQYSLNLFRSSLSDRLGLAVFTKLLQEKAEASATDAVGLELIEGRDKERARVKAAADEVNAVRHENLRTFLP